MIHLIFAPLQLTEQFNQPVFFLKQQLKPCKKQLISQIELCNSFVFWGDAD